MRLCVFDEETGLDDFIGQYSIPIHACRTGFRCVPLLDKIGQQIEDASIVVELRKQTINTTKYKIVRLRVFYRQLQSQRTLWLKFKIVRLRVSYRQFQSQRML